LANQLEVKNNRLTGEVSGEVVTASRKASFLEEICVQLDINVRQAIAVGDGANDIEMLNTAGLGVAYRAKKIVQQQADVALNYSGLNALLDFLHAA
ncbi:MAG: HAD hydrolase family protein, partial [Thiohalomonadales bacterium]